MMQSTELLVTPSRTLRERIAGSGAAASNPVLYILLLLIVAAGAGAYGLRRYSIFNCPASGYGFGFLTYCGAANYGDYDHGVFWFGIEPEAIAAVTKAHVLFVGNSRTTFGFSSTATTDWFNSEKESYYLLGFPYWENHTYEAPLIQKLKLSPKVYIINIDSFFKNEMSGPGETVMKNDDAVKTRYEQKRSWQTLHKTVCTTLRFVCGKGSAIYRAPATGAWIWEGVWPTSALVSYDDSEDANAISASTAEGNKFLQTVSTSRDCIILTILPAAGTETGNAKAIARGLNLPLIAPKLAGLNTFDGSHLDHESATRWSAAFFEEAGPQIRQCLSR